MQSQMNYLQSQLLTAQNEIKSLRSQLDQFQVQNVQYQAKCNENIIDIIKMQSVMCNTANDKAHPEPVVQPNDPTPPNPKVLLDLAAGSSILRDLDEDQLDNTKVISISGAKPKLITSIFTAKKKDGERFNSISLAIGGNRLGRDGNPREKVQIAAEEVMETVSAAKLLSETVKVLELPPRLKTTEMTLAISELNSEVQRRCEEQQVEFVHTNGVFYLRNGNPNAALIDDDLVHPTVSGSKEILTCLGLQVRDGSYGVAAKAAYKNKPKRRKPVPSHTNSTHVTPENESKKVTTHAAEQGMKKSQKKNQAKNPPQHPAMGGQSRYFGHASTGYSQSSRQERNHIPLDLYENIQEKSPTHSRSYQQHPKQRDSQRFGQRNSHENTHEKSPTHGRNYQQYPKQRDSQRSGQGDIYSASARNSIPVYNTMHAPQNGKFTQHKPPVTQQSRQSRQSSIPFDRKPWAQPAPDYTQERICTDVCQLCNLAGHKATACKAKDKDCYHCHRQGHFSRVCPY